MLLRAAIRADSSYFLPYDLYLSEMKTHHRFDQLRREFPEPPASSTSLAQCVSAAARFPRGFDYVALNRVIQRLDRLPDPSGCRASIAARQRFPFSPERALAEIREALAREPESDNTLWLRYAEILNALGRRSDAAAALVQGIRQSPHPLHALVLQVALVGQRLLMGDSAGALNLQAAIGASVARDGRPFLMWYHIEYAADRARSAGNIPLFRALTETQEKIAHDANGFVQEWWNAVNLGSTLLESEKDPKASIAPLTRAVLLADRIGIRSLIMQAYQKRGRAFEKKGDVARAESDLRRALAFTDADDHYDIAEAHHNLAHLYERQAMWADAVREIDLYSRHARRAQEGFTADYMMSLRDGGMVKWNAGLHAAARQSFEAMVRVIESRKENYLYAGEYYERAGDYARALGYYRRGAAQNLVTDRPGNLAGLTRMFAALGMRDSARAAATQHDQPAYLQGESRLLPAILVADGHADEAIRLARIDVTEQEKKASVAGTTTATIQLARLLLDAGRAEAAGREALRAERLAASANLRGEAIEALVLRGRAQLRAREPASLVTLRRARALVRVNPTVAAERDVELAIADAYAEFGPSAEALAAYDRAAGISQRVTAAYDSADYRARSRDQQIASFDGALRVLLRMPESRTRLEQLFSWSTRKKDAVLNHGDGGHVAMRPSGLSDVVRGLDRETALVDYVVVDSGISALIVTVRTVQVVRLPLSRAATSGLVQRLRRPLVSLEGGQLDLGRAPFDLGVAHELYAGVFAPLERFLGGIWRLIIAPDGPLYGVPFSALPRAVPSRTPNNAYHAADYLLDRYTISLVTSFALAGVTTSRGEAPDARVLVIQGPVTAGEREAGAIAGAWPAGRTAIVAGPAATERAVRQQMHGPSVIHFAVHARADESDDLASYLELVRDARDDGLLHATEIASLDLRDALVVLTGCETLPGRVFAGTGPFGIANAFVAAGARSVIATQWPVGESAADLSRDLHRALARGVPASDALRDAQLALRRNPSRAHPFHWGGYVLIRGR